MNDCFKKLLNFIINLFQYIDPISRGASAKSRANVVEIDHQPTNEDNYSRANDRIREWAAKSSQNEPLNLPPSIVAANDYEAEQYEMDGRRKTEHEEEEEELYGRRTGKEIILNFLNQSFKVVSETLWSLLPNHQSVPNHLRLTMRRTMINMRRKVNVVPPSNALLLQNPMP